LFSPEKLPALVGLERFLGDLDQKRLRREQEIIKVIECIPHIVPLTKVIPLKLFLDIVPSSSEEATRAMRGQRKRDEMAETSFYMFRFRFRPVIFSELSAIFLFGQAFVCFVLIWLFIISLFIRF